MNLAISRFYKQHKKTRKRKRKNDDAEMKRVLVKQRTDSIRKAVKQVPCCVPIRNGDDNKIFSGLEKCGQSKSTIFFEVMRQLKQNKTHSHNENRVGFQGSKTVNLSRDKYEASQYIKTISDKSGPVVLLVDGCKDLQIAPIRRMNGRYPYTLKELARDTIMKWTRLYCVSPHVEMVCILMDVNRCCSALRKIQRLKRNKEQNVQSHFNNQQKKRTADDLLSSYGDFSDLMRNSKSGFVEVFAQEIVNQLKCSDEKNQGWEPSKLFSDMTFGFIGGSPDCCAFVGRGEKETRISSNVSMTRTAIEQKMEHVVNQGEGERMIITFMREIITATYTCCSSRSLSEKMYCDTCFELHCEDLDLIAASMFFVRSLHYTQNTRGRMFRGSIFIRAREKSAASVIKLHPSFIDGLGIDMNQQPCGKGWVVQIDVISLYYNLEDSKKLVDTLPSGHRAISAVTIAFIFMNCDYIPPIIGLKYHNFINALSSKEFKEAVVNFGEDTCSPVYLHPHIFEDGPDSSNQLRSSLNLSGILLLFTIMMMKRKKKRNHKRKYSGDSYFSLFTKKSIHSTYDLVRAISLYVPCMCK